jgi:hypothetical protein
MFLDSNIFGCGCGCWQRFGCPLVTHHWSLTQLYGNNFLYIIFDSWKVSEVEREGCNLNIRDEDNRF